MAVMRIIAPVVFAPLVAARIFDAAVLSEL